MRKCFSVMLSSILLLLSFQGALLAKPANVQRVVALVGTDVGEMRAVAPELGIYDERLCFDVDLVDIRTNKVIGTASDCLLVLDPEKGDGDGLRVEGTTIFNFPQGTLITRGLTTVQPVLHGSEEFSHITGAIPGASDNSVIAGTRRFEGMIGTSRLSGSVLMEPLPDGSLQITFNCLFVIDLE
jgi:hypothetical protein